MPDPTIKIPEGMDFVGGGDFVATGKEFLGHFRELCDLRPDEQLLDVGCGIGRMAVPLTGYLNARGSYHGIDVVAKGIRWCQDNIASRYRNFNFVHADIRNRQYNPKGRLLPREYRFPFAADTFDFVFLTSVFTHMLPDDLEHYLAETFRVLRCGGRTLISYFLLNPESRALIARGRSNQQFKFELGFCKTVLRRNPEAAIAYPEEHIRKLYAGQGLSLREPIRYGSWCGRENFLSYQDLVIAEKTA